MSWLKKVMVDLGLSENDSETRRVPTAADRRRQRLGARITIAGAMADVVVGVVLIVSADSSFARFMGWAILVLGGVAAVAGAMIRVGSRRPG